MSDPRFEGKPLPQSRFSGDVGAIDPGVAQCLADYSAGHASLREVQRSLVGTRLLVPTVAGLDEERVDAGTGLRTESRSHLAAVTLQSEAGWTGLLAFTSVEAVRAWDANARPVPVSAQEAAQAALTDGNTVLVVDLAGPVRVALTGTYLRALAQGRRAVPPIEDPVVTAAVESVSGGVPGLRRAEWRPSPTPEADAILLLHLQPGADAPDVAARLARALAEHPDLRDRLDAGLALAIAP